MKNFDWSILLPLSGGVLLAVGNRMGIKAFWLVLILAILLFAMFLLALIRFFKVKSLENEKAELEKQLSEKEREFKNRLSSSKVDFEKQQSKFFSEISHSLRMPVSIIQGYAELLQSGTLDFTTESEYINKIVEHTYRMTDILSGKLDDPNSEMVRTTAINKVELIELVEQQLEDMRKSAEGKGVSLQAVHSEDKIFVNADPRQLQRIFSNLVENSLKYMGREGMVTVLLAQQEKMAHITVRDDGMGLSESEAKHIFDEGYRGSNSQNAKGSGYGLYMIKQSVEAQHGEIHATSQPGRGMTISFTLPLVKEMNVVNA